MTLSSQPVVPAAPRASPAPPVKQRHAGRWGWHALSLGLASIVVLPVLGVLAAVAAGDAGSRDVLAHLFSTVLPEYAWNSLWISLVVASGVACIGIACAWLVAAHDFPGKRLFEWALILPLAMPAYVMAYAYTDFLQYAGPLQSALRRLPGARWLSWFPEIRSWYGAAFVFIFAFYPYVYLLARTAFIERSPRLSDAARTLGCSPWAGFWRVSLPLARPAAVAGIALVLMETLADYGAVAYFGVPTFTTGIYRAWLSMGDRTAAAQLASMLLGFVLVLLVLEARSRSRLRFYSAGQRFYAAAPVRLRGKAAWLAVLACAAPLVFGFVLPVSIMIRLAWQDAAVVPWQRYGVWVGNTLVLAAISALLAALCAVLLAYARR